MAASRWLVALPARELEPRVCVTPVPSGFGAAGDERRSLRHQLEPLAQIVKLVTQRPFDFGYHLEPISVLGVVRAGQAQQARDFGSCRIATKMRGQQSKQALDLEDVLGRSLERFLERPEQVQTVPARVHDRGRAHQVADDLANFFRRLLGVLEINIDEQTIELAHRRLAALLRVWGERRDAEI